MRGNTMIKTLAALGILVFQICSYAADQPANSESRQGSSTATGSERKSDKSKSNTSRKSITVTNEIGVGALFLQDLQLYENKKEFPCSVFNAEIVVYTDPGGGIKYIAGAQSPHITNGATRVMSDNNRVSRGKESQRF